MHTTTSVLVYLCKLEMRLVIQSNKGNTKINTTEISGDTIVLEIFAWLVAQFNCTLNKSMHNFPINAHVRGGLVSSR